MSKWHSIYPSLCEWPTAIADVKSAPIDSEKIRLISGAKNIELLKSYQNLKSLWCFDITEKNLTSICESKNLRALYIENVKTDNLSYLFNLPNLRVLSLETCSKLKSLESLGAHKLLSALAITNFKNIHDLEPLSNLENISTLAISGSMWTKMKVKTFKPLSVLKNLEFLELTSMRTIDNSLKPIGELKKLRQLKISNFYPTTEFVKLSKKLKNTECAWFKPYMKMKVVCGKCGVTPLVLLTGRGKSTLCPRCNIKLLEKYKKEWYELDTINS